MSIMQDQGSVQFSITRYDQVNFSKSKMTYSFGKGKRFNSTARQAHNTIGYDLPSTLNKRSPGFGYGTRFKTPEVIREKKGKECK